jgi:hypothetical protein
MGIFFFPRFHRYLGWSSSSLVWFFFLFFFVFFLFFFFFFFLFFFFFFFPFLYSVVQSDFFCVVNHLFQLIHCFLFMSMLVLLCIPTVCGQRIDRCCRRGIVDCPPFPSWGRGWSSYTRFWVWILPLALFFWSPARVIWRVSFSGWDVLIQRFFRCLVDLFVTWYSLVTGDP